ncbi:methyltransferase type 11 [Fimicolochytrium jonesii]|uniref:methyltransferase type 11 n=1 Tax=Fimicolochytrium jonesii TaxID=1396493 RepID=UPI0022FDBC8F|nr:methyltransferase type 11 [Fimicolochytrium jonesii]KAI8820143.1 methyltransferase type 11 [Fimicolochytrium jonesii]
MQGATETEVRRIVRDNYAQVPKTADREGSTRVAQAFGYSLEELTAIPVESNMGLSCGNPTAVANLKEGETVVDLGSGGGLDVFLAAKAVGATGKAIGIDMTFEMIDLARRNASKAQVRNVEFYLGEIEHMPIESNTTDCVISNCVINLCPNKDVALREIYRILKPGGRLAISDIALKQEVPPALQDNLSAYVGCVTGAIQIKEYKALLHGAGFQDVVIVDSNADLSVYTFADNGCCGSGASCGPAVPAEVVPDAKAEADGDEPCGCGPTCCDGSHPDTEASCCASSCCGKDEKKGASAPAKSCLKDWDVNAFAGMHALI